ncbi:MAG: histidine phosphatase family protein [Chitinophagaceae bacterium]
MKTLIVIRHAKSSWDVPDQEDRERPLNERGKQNGPEMAKRLKKKGVKPDLLVSSPAVRALRTARYFAKEFKFGKKNIVLEEKLYAAGVDAFHEVVAALRDKYNAVALFSHNPGITEYVNTLSEVHVDNMPTCAVFAVTADTNQWASFKEALKSFLFFDYPKNPLE